jgi:hypothetical protein
MAVMWPDTPPFGEVKPVETLYQKQIASTIARLLGFTFVPDDGIAEPILTIFQ